MVVLSVEQIEEVSGADWMTSCLAVGGASATVAGIAFTPVAAAGAGLAGCAVGIALYYW